MLGFSFSSNLEPYAHDGWNLIANLELHTPGLTRSVPGAAAGIPENSPLASPRGGWLISADGKAEYKRVMRHSPALKLFSQGPSIVDYAKHEISANFVFNSKELEGTVRKALLSITVGNWAVEHKIVLRMNSEPEITILNTALLFSQVKKAGHYTFMRVDVPIAVKALKNGKNRLSFKAKSLPGYVPKACLVIRRVYLSVQI